MSEPTYLIRVEHDPTSITLEWSARVERLADGSHAITRYGSSEEEAVRAAQAWMRAEYAPKRPPREFYAGEDGEMLAGESVRVLRQP